MSRKGALYVQYLKSERN